MVLSELAHIYELSTFRSSYFLFKVKTNKRHLSLTTKQNDGAWKYNFFFVKRESIPNGDLLPMKWVKKVRI